MALTTRLLSTTRSSVPWRVGEAIRSRLASRVRALAGWAAAAQLGPDREKEIGRHTGART